MIIEGILTTANHNGQPNIAPMGPRVHGDFRSLTLRPFKGSTTYENLLATGQGVFHIVDEIDLIAACATHSLDELPPMDAAKLVNGHVLQDCCRWFEFQVNEKDLSEDRTTMKAEIVHRAEGRCFRGFNRAKHAVIEAAILATRVDFLPFDTIQDDLNRLQPAVSKTGGKTEVMAFEQIRMFVEQNRRTKINVGP